MLLNISIAMVCSIPTAVRKMLHLTQQKNEKFGAMLMNTGLNIVLLPILFNFRNNIVQLFYTRFRHNIGSKTSFNSVILSV